MLQHIVLNETKSTESCYGSNWTSKKCIRCKEYWMIYRGLCFLVVVWYGSSPKPSQPLPSVSSIGDTQENRERNTTCSRQPNHLRRESMVLYKSFDTLWLDVTDVILTVNNSKKMIPSSAESSPTSKRAIYYANAGGCIVSGPEMEFLDISLTKDSLLLNAIHSPYNWRISQKTRLYSGFENLHTKIYSWMTFYRTKKGG